MHQSIILAAGFAAIAAASPAPQAIDFASILAAPTPTLTGPPADVTVQAISIDAASVSASASAAVTGVVTASATASVAASDDKQKRWLWFNWGTPSKATTTSCTTTSTPTPTSTSCTTSSTSVIKVVSATSDVAPSTTVAPPATTPYVNMACATQPDGYGPKVQPDTPEAFESYAEFATEANDAVTPSGYTATFKNYNASINGATYLGLTTYTTYDVAKCGAQCDSTSLCTGFNIYVERDPSVNPSDDCANPPSITNYKCTLWGSSVDQTIATNYGQWRDSFDVVIAGSNAYTKTVAPPTQPGWQAPQSCGGGKKAHSHPKTCLGQHFFPGPYNPAVCSSFAASQNKVNSAKSGGLFSFMGLFGFNPYKCTFFNAYMLKKDGAPMGTYCSLFAQNYGSSEATYSPGVQSGFSWEIESSWSYTASW